jgi:acetone carboxylase gamma subunit
MPEYNKEILKDLIDGKLPWPVLKKIMSDQKDETRFERYLEILQERTGWSEPILVPIAEHLYVIQKGGDRVVRCDCGHEFGDYRRNWKTGALMYVRDSEIRLDEIYEGLHKPDPEWAVIREYYCPGCAAQLEVEAVPPGYPILFDFLPDIDGFYDARPALKKKVMGSG